VRSRDCQSGEKGGDDGVVLHFGGWLFGEVETSGKLWWSLGEWKS
jgi:hypothetical protein